MLRDLFGPFVSWLLKKKLTPLPLTVTETHQHYLKSARLSLSGAVALLAEIGRAHV